jgi:hypothetical protein
LLSPLALQLQLPLSSSFAFAVACPLPHTQEPVISTEAAHSLIVSSAVEKSAFLPQTSARQRVSPPPLVEDKSTLRDHLQQDSFASCPNLHASSTRADLATATVAAKKVSSNELE